MQETIAKGSIEQVLSAGTAAMLSHHFSIAAAAFSAATALFNCGRPLVVGSLGAGTYNGAALIDTTAIWSRELTSTERTALWNSGAGVNYAATASL